MSIFDSKVWKQIRKNKFLYSLIHNTIGRMLSEFELRGRKNSIKENGLSIINEIDNAFQHSGITFFVDFGTLLGFVREGKLLSWDYDIDFGVQLTESYTWEDLESLLNQHDFYLLKQFRYKGTITEQTYHREDIYIDFFNHFSDKNNSYYYVYFKKNNYEYDDENLLHARVTYTRKIQNNKLLEFDGGKVHVPENPEDYLEDVYGADWITPKKDWNPDSMKNIEWLEEFGMLESFND